MDMNMLMYMDFWKGNEMNFLFMNAYSYNKGQYWLGLTVCFVAAIVFEVIQHLKMILQNVALAKIAAHQIKEA